MEIMVAIRFTVTMKILMFSWVDFGTVDKNRFRTTKEGVEREPVLNGYS